MYFTHVIVRAYTRPQISLNSERSFFSVMHQIPNPPYILQLFDTWQWWRLQVQGSQWHLLLLDNQSSQIRPQAGQCLPFLSIESMWWKSKAKQSKGWRFAPPASFAVAQNPPWFRPAPLLLVKHISCHE